MDVKQKGNVLVIGNSGVGKSTLINAVLGENVAKTGFGIKGTQDRLDIYESKEIPFRIIDTIGFEPTVWKQWKAIRKVREWSRKSAKEGKEDTQINVIWFCVDGAAAKLFPKTIENLSKATSMWKSVPIITVITKSFANGDTERNIEMVQNAFATQKRYSKNLKKIIPVVADKYVINEDITVFPKGITELIDATVSLMPEGIRAAEDALIKFKLARKRAFAQSAVAGYTALGVGISITPIPSSPALTALETVEINSIEKIYGLCPPEGSTKLRDSIITTTTVGVAAKTAVDTLKKIPGINVAAGVISGVVAGVVVAVIGEASIYIFEKIYKGDKSYEDIDTEWIAKVIESKFTNELLEKMKEILKNINAGSTKDEIAKVIINCLKCK